MITPPPTVACHAPVLIDRMKAAIGGGAWRGVGAVTATGEATISGLHGTFSSTADLRSGTYVRHFTIRVMGSSAEGFDGRTAWGQDISGGVHSFDAPFARKRARTEAYLARDGYFSANDPASLRCLGETRDDGATVDRIGVTPAGGIPAVLAIDATTHLLASVSERLPTTTEVTRYSDYREYAGVVLPFAITSGTIAEPEDGYAALVQSYALRSTANAAEFRAPVDAHPVEMLDGATSTTVPLRIEGRQLLVWASIDGHPSAPFILDTGGHAILTAQAARTFGVHAAGAGVSGGSGAGTISLQYAPVARIRIGNAVLHDQRFLVIPYPYSFYERGDKTPVAGILGLEVFERLAARIDYGRGHLTLTPLQHYVHPATGRSLPIVFQEDMPLGVATADGHSGLFGIDTGNGGTVILFGDFLERSGLERVYPGGVRAEGHGTGGSDAGRIVMLHRFTLAGRSFDTVPTFLTHMHDGSFSSWTEAGNFGYEVLSRFVPTFDYARGVLYLDDSPYAHAPPKNRAGFIAGKDDPSAFVVLRVAPGSNAAAAGLRAGDRIIAVDGTPSEQVSFGDLYDRMIAAPGSVLTLRVQSGTTSRDIRVVLR
jgi:membrane-associated protease RseP (regulator of RpoE activity)